MTFSVCFQSLFGPGNVVMLKHYLLGIIGSEEPVSGFKTGGWKNDKSVFVPMSAIKK